MPADFYGLLGVAPTASAEEIKRAFETLSSQLQSLPSEAPGVSERLNLLAEAYRTLISPKERARYDARMRLGPIVPPDDTGRPTIGPRSGSRTPPAPDPNAPLRMSVMVGGPVSAPLRERERLYALVELTPIAPMPAPPVAPLNLALLAPRSLLAGATSAEMMRHAVDTLPSVLRDRDRLTLAFYDAQTYALLDGEYVAGRAGLGAGLGAALDSVGGADPREASDLASALDITLARLARHIAPGSISALALLTDASRGADAARCLDIAERARQLGVSFFILGLGLDWDRALHDDLATITGGSSVFVDDPRYLTHILAEQVERLRATLASRLRLTLEPAPGVSVLRAARISPELEAVFEGPHMPGAPVAVALGALAGGPDAHASVALWETLLEPSALAPASSGWLTLGTIQYSYWAPWVDGGRIMRGQAPLAAPASAALPPVAPPVRLAVELLTASRMQTRADRMLAGDDVDEAAAALDMSARRLASAGEAGMAEEAARAVTALREGQPQAVMATLRARYGLRAQSPYHYLRRG